MMSLSPSRRLAMKRTLNIALALGLGSCGGTAAPTATAHDPAPPVPQSEPAQVDRSIEASLARLRGLEIVNVDRLVLRLPAEATACYNLPCPGSGWEQRYRDERAQQATRLANLVNIAEGAKLYTNPPARDMSEASAALQA